MNNEIIFYSLNGKIKEIVLLDKNNLEEIDGMMTRCTMKDGTEVVGLANVFKTCETNFDSFTVGDYIYLSTWDNLDEKSHKLSGTVEEKYNQTHTKVYIEDIIKVESILHSNPRWGGLLTNKFIFIN